MGLSRLQRLLRILAVTLLGASSCSASTQRVLKTNTHCIIANGQALCPGDELNLDSDFVTISAGFPDNSKILQTWKPFWEETIWIGSSSYLTLPGFDKSMKNIFFGEDSCLYGNVGWGFVTVNAQLIKCINQQYVGDPYPNPWAVRDYGPLFPKDQLDLSEPAHNKKGADFFDYRQGSEFDHDPQEKLPPANGINPLLRGKHQDSQWGIPDVEYPSAQPPVYDTTGPPLSYPPKKVRPIRPYPAPGVGIDKMPNIYDLPSFLPACPKNKPNCNKRPTPEEIRREGSVSDPNTNVATTDSSGDSAPATADSSKDTATTATTTATTDGTVVGGTIASGSVTTDTPVPAASTAAASTDGTTVASTDGTVTSTDGTAASTGGTVSSTGGTVASTDGTVTSSDGTVASTGGTVAPTGDAVASADSTLASTGGTVASTDTTVAGLSTTNNNNQDLTARAFPNDNTSFGKKSRRTILHPRDFRVQ